MTVGRPELVETIATAGRLNPSRVETSTRRQMEADQLDRVKGRKTPSRRSYGPKEGSTALLGLPGGSDAPEAYAALAFLRAEESSGGIVLDPVGRLLPDLQVATPDEEENDRIELRAFLTALLSNISGLSPEQAASLRRGTEARSVWLELSTDPASALFRWTADGTVNGEERWVRFKYPGTPLEEIFGTEPAYETVTRLYFPLLFAVGRLFAAAPAHHSADPAPSSGKAPASADPEKETPPRPGRRPSVTGPATAEPGTQHSGRYGEGEKSSSPYRCHGIGCLSQLLHRDYRPNGLPR